MSSTERSCFIYQLCDQIWAGGYPDEAAIQRLTAEGVKTYADLTRRDEQWVYRIKDYGNSLPSGAKHFKFALWTYWLPPLTKLLEIVSIVEGNTPSYVHCRQGLDRTGVVAALILLKRGMGLDEALSYLKRARGTASPRKPYHLKYLKKCASALRDNDRREIAR